MRQRTALIGVGNPWRGDDGIGWAVVVAAGRRVGSDVVVIEVDGEPSRLLDAWTGLDLAVVVDGVRSGAPPGNVHVWLDETELSRTSGSAGSHALGLADAIALGHAVDRLPQRLVVVGIEVDDTSPGQGLSPAVAAAVDDAVAAIEELLQAGS